MLLATEKFEVWGLTGSITTETAEQSDYARERLWHWISEIDQACNRFKDGTEIQRINAAGGKRVHVSPTFELALDAALRSSQMTEGLCDPTVLDSLLKLGYNRDYSTIKGTNFTVSAPLHPSPGINAINYSRDDASVTLHNCTIDLGASAKALTADLIANDVMEFGGVAVEIGGDVALRGLSPRSPWTIGISDSLDVYGSEPRIAMGNGGVATSSLGTRTWNVNNKTVNHIIDPRTGNFASGPYATASVSAIDCVTANAFATAALLWGEDAGFHIAQAGWSARLVRSNGEVEYFGGWPMDHE